MLRWISIFGGFLIMMGQHDRSEALFYLEDQVPENHLLRLIDKHVSLEFARALADQLQRHRAPFD
jgi:hypothetical protein